MKVSQKAYVIPCKSVVFIHHLYGDLGCNVPGNAKIEVKISNKISVLLGFFSENAYVMLFSHSMETSFPFL